MVPRSHHSPPGSLGLTLGGGRCAICGRVGTGAQGGTSQQAYRSNVQARTFPTGHPAGVQKSPVLIFLPNKHRSALCLSQHLLCPPSFLGYKPWCFVFPGCLLLSVPTPLSQQTPCLVPSKYTQNLTSAHSLSMLPRPYCPLLESCTILCPFFCALCPLVCPLPGATRVLLRQRSEPLRPPAPQHLL